jgi:putative membrane protein
VRGFGRAFISRDPKITIFPALPQKGTDPKVKDFGNRMINDHTKANGDLKPIVDAGGVQWLDKPPQDAQATYDRLSKLSGDQFDREFVTVMVKDHRKVAHLYQQELGKANDRQLKTYIGMIKGQRPAARKSVFGL